MKSGAFDQLLNHFLFEMALPRPRPRPRPRAWSVYWSTIDTVIKKGRRFENDALLVGIKEEKRISSLTCVERLQCGALGHSDAHTKR